MADLPRSSRPPRWRLSYATRLTISSSLIAMMTAIILSLMLVVAWGQELSSFAENRMNQIAESAAESLQQRYELLGEWNKKTLQGMQSISAITPGTAIGIYDSAGKVLYNDFEYKLQDPWVDAMDRDLSAQPAVSVPIIVDEKIIGNVTVTSMNRESIVPYESEFRASTYRAVVVASCIAVVLASIIGFLLTRDFVRPISLMTDMASEIKRGHLDVRTNMSDQDELGNLGRTLDGMAEHLEVARQYERQITTDVAHELRTPLMAMQVTIEAMIDGVMPANPERLGVLNSEIVRMGRLVDAQMRLSKLESRSMLIEGKVIDLSQTVAEIIDVHSMLIEESGLTFSSELEPNIMVLGDNDLLKQAVGNLLSNAVRYTPAGGKIEASVKADNQYARIEVSDTGIGLSVDDIAKVFNKFWRADSGRERSSGGLGIGLAMVKEIADLFRGWVDVSSVEGQGSSFTLVIPLYKAKAKTKTKGRGKGKIRK